MKTINYDQVDHWLKEEQANLAALLKRIEKYAVKKEEKPVKLLNLLELAKKLQ